MKSPLARRSSTTRPALALSCLLALAPASSPATAAEAASGLTVSGSVKKPRSVSPSDLAGLPRRALLARVAGAAGRYRGTYEMEGVALKDLLDRAGIAKAVDDGFDRPLDLSVVVTGRGGEKALYSWGELFLADDSGAALLADRLRPFVPHHHEPITDPRFAPGSWLGAEARASLDVSGCATCHDGGKLSRIDVPRGLCLVPVRDRDARRFVEDVVSVEVRQAGFPAPPRKKDAADPWVEAPSLVLPAGPPRALTAEALKGVPRVEGESDAVGLGRGYRGRSRWGGASLAAVLKAALPEGFDPGLLSVVVTASDGYRSLYSGGEVFLSRLGENVVLVDTEDGKPLFRKSGRLKSIARGDFFVDRSVRSLAEVRVLLAR